MECLLAQSGAPGRRRHTLSEQLVFPPGRSETCLAMTDLGGGTECLKPFAHCRHVARALPVALGGLRGLSPAYGVYGGMWELFKALTAPSSRLALGFPNSGQ